MDEVANQISQMKAALEHASEEDKAGIQLIIDQLQELLGLYPTTTTTVTPGGSSSNVTADEDCDDEYNLFQAEIAALSSEATEPAGHIPSSVEANTTSEPNERLEEHPRLPDNEDNGDDSNPANVSSAIGNDLEALIGMKCMAPHQESWGQIGYYSAMVSSVLSLEEGESEDNEPSDFSSIMVRVMFLQPVVKSQLLCPFYQEDRCRFTDSDCKFSHGDVVPLSQLREYSDPDYSLVIPGCRVLAKYGDGLWYKATVQKITDDGECEVSYDVGNEACTLPLHETVPVDNECKTSDLDSSEEDDVENPGLSSDSESEMQPRTLLGDELLDIKNTSALGIWEQYTKGIGSKLMQQMGYVMGTGLGRNREGRVEPVDAIVLPPGKSLDVCMALKEKAKDGNLFSAEKRRLRLQRRAERQRAKQAEQKPKEESNVFEFLNKQLAIRKTNIPVPKEDTAALRKQTSSNLNKRLFNLSESINQVRKDIAKTKESMKRHEGRDKETYSVMAKKLETLETRRRELDAMQGNIAKEQRARLDKRKLDLF